MKKSKFYTNEILKSYQEAGEKRDQNIFGRKVNDVLVELAIHEPEKLMYVRTLAGTLSVLKQQRYKFSKICAMVNEVNHNLISVSDFDNAIKEIYPEIYETYLFILTISILC